LNWVYRMVKIITYHHFYLYVLNKKIEQNPYLDKEKKTTTGGFVVLKKWNGTKILVEDITGYLKYMNCL